MFSPSFSTNGGFTNSGSPRTNWIVMQTKHLIHEFSKSVISSGQIRIFGVPTLEWWFVTVFWVLSWAGEIQGVFRFCQKLRSLSGWTFQYHFRFQSSYHWRNPHFGGKEILLPMMTSSIANASHITGPLWGESTNHPWTPFTWASNVGLW